MLLAGNLNFKLRIVFWNIFFLEIWTFKKRITLSEKKPPLKTHFFSIFSRPSYVIPKKEQIRSRKLSGPRTKAPRALSPINYKVKEYLARADEKIEDYLERIVQNVDSAQFMVKSCVQKLRDWKGIFLCWHKKQSYLKWQFLVLQSNYSF